MTDTNPNWHLEKSRPPHSGYTIYAPISSEFGHRVSVSASKVGVDGQDIWLKAKAPVDLDDPTGPAVEAWIHLTMDNAVRLAAQLITAARDHGFNLVELTALLAAATEGRTTGGARP